jgi:competence protein ComGC
LPPQSKFSESARVETFPPFRREPAGRAAGRANFGMDNRRRQGQGRRRETSDMKLRLCCRNRLAMTLLEVIAVIAAVLILFALLLPFLAATKKKSAKIGCTNNVKQIGLAFRIWEGDNGDLYPMGVSVTHGGAKELVQAGNVVSVFQVMSNELSTPKVVVCPNDANAFYATNFGGLANSNISYFASVDVTNELNPKMLVSGDCNFEIGRKPIRSGLVLVSAKDSVGWSATRHEYGGNLLFTDGRVDTMSSRRLPDYFIQTGIATNRLAIP